MNKHRTLIALACLSFLHGPAALAQVPTKLCKDVSGICNVPVVVTLSGSNQCTVTVPDVDAEKTQMRIQWTIVTNPGAPDVFFDPVRGIEFTDPRGWDIFPPGPNARRTFVKPTAAHDGAYYAVHLQVMGPNPFPCDVDPIINNDF